MPDAVSDNDVYDLQKKWKTVLGLVEVQIGNPADFNAYLKDTVATSLQDGVLCVTVKNGFIAAWIRQRVMRSLRRFADQVFESEIKIQLETMAFMSSDILAREGLAGDYSQWADVHISRQRAALARENARFFPAITDRTFDTFERSDCNAKAMDAARSVANHPCAEFNPLTITAETGQGKTHLLNAIANQMRQNEMNVICLTGEEFVDSFVKSSRSGNVVTVRDRYRGVDALLVDGIERLIGKTGTQTFFLSIVEHLISNQKQLVFTFNTAYPMQELGEEITSRLSGGLEIQIAPPDLALKRSILSNYLIQHNLELPTETFDAWASRFARSVREIIGGVARVNANRNLKPNRQFAQSVSSPTITIASIDEALRDRLAAPAPLLPSSDKIFEAVAEVFDINPHTLRQTGRGNRSVSAARDLAIYMLREKCGLTSTETGNLMGGRPHSTISASLNRYSERRQTDQQLAEAERRVERLLS